MIQKLGPRLGTTDFAPYLTQILRETDAVFAVVVAASSLRFPKQYGGLDSLRGQVPGGGGTS